MHQDADRRQGQELLQDRLVKEMRLRGIDAMAAGNAYLPEFMADFNGRFAVAPRNPADAHRALAQGEEAAPVEDEKSVRLRVDRAKAEQQSRPTWKPAPDHPWRQPFKPEATGVAAG